MEQIRTEHGSSRVVWEHVSCPLCGGGRARPELSKYLPEHDITCHLVRCADCAMVHLNPRPDRDTIGYFYPDDYHAYRAPKPGLGFAARVRHRLRKLVLSHKYGYPSARKGVWGALLATLAAPWFGPDRASHASIPYCGDGRYLDVGCGGGDLAARMASYGWKVTGLDFSAHAVERVRTEHGLPALLGSLPHPEVLPASFDLINMGAVLEHVHDPHELISAAVEALDRQGSLVLSVPNYGCRQARRFGIDWESLHLPQHLLHFTPDTLHRLITGHGLRVRELRLINRANWLRNSYRNRARRTGSSLKLRLLASRPISRWLARWAGRRGEGNCLFLIAEKERASATSRAA